MIDLIAANHTDRELELMLDGKKPLAMFYEDLSFLPDEALIPENKFAPHVTSGKMVRRETVIKGPFSPRLDRDAQVKFVLFALTEEEWRIDAMLLLKEQHQKTLEWNETCERIESSLLGYTEEETDAWCKRNFT